MTDRYGDRKRDITADWLGKTEADRKSAKKSGRRVTACDINILLVVFSQGDATLHLAVSVVRSVGPSVGPSHF